MAASAQASAQALGTTNLGTAGLIRAEGKLRTPTYVVEAATEQRAADAPLPQAGATRAPTLVSCSGRYSQEENNVTGKKGASLPAFSEHGEECCFVY